MRARAVLKFMTGPLCDASAWMMHVLAGGSVAVDASVLTSHFSPHYSLHFQTSCIVVFINKLNSSVKECEIVLIRHF